ncbi:9f078a80-ceb8-436b-9432-6c194b713432 [Thermothielavioides terrestris]|uniref:9f078a80-ceb8-436b-9432-6c194b713432 n=1 Tax=Thermothielavioides terrestris TaxID=2587410 RepID=A0A3S4F1E4_9PEZI|nr:9f078a80-ceb8-436b-9432-6c194b713432 [Thermothielavioides terrestris]
MGRLGPVTSQGLQLYDERGRPINPETKRINRDVIRSHNEVMMVIGVAEPENGFVEAQAEAARRHRQYEDRVGRRLLLAGGVFETAAIWGVNGMRQRILLYKPYSHTSFYGMFQLARSQQSLSSYFFGGLPSFLASTVLEQLAVPGSREYPMIQYAVTYIRLHLAVYTFFQRSRIIPFSEILPNWRFFVPGTGISPIPLPPLPSSLRPRSLLQWLGAFALGAAPFAGFYLYTKFYSFLIRTLRYKIHRLLPRPHNATKRRSFRDGASLPPGTDAIPIEIRTSEPIQTPDPPTNEPSPGGPSRRQSTPSLRGNGPSGTAGQDDFASDDEEAEIISATLISFDVEASDPTPDPTNHSPGTAAANGDAAAANTNTPTPGVWSAELRPNLADSAAGRAAGAGPDSGGPPEPLYRETVLTRLPAVLATDVLAVTPARLLMTPLATLVWLPLARAYMARRGLPLDDVVRGAGWWWGLHSARALVNLLGLELLLAVVHGEAWALVTLVAGSLTYSEEEWNEREGVRREGDGDGDGEGEGDGELI